MSVEDVSADASPERNEYHKLPMCQLNELDDAESHFQRGDRLMNGFGTDTTRKISFII
jgi:hypothetical protein